MNLKQVHEIVKQIQNVSGRIDKENILAAHKDNDDLKYILDTVYNPFIILGLGDKKLKKFMKGKVKESLFNNLRDVIEYLKIHNTGKDVDAELVAEYLLNVHDEDLRQFAYEVIIKSLKLGINTKGINKIIPNLIPEFGCLLAEKFHEEVENIEDEMFATLKLDGHRMLAIKENGTINFYSRKGQPIEGLSDLFEEIKQLPDNYVYDGEALLKNDNNLHSAELYRETSKIIRKDGLKKNIEFHIFDLVPLEEYRQGISNKKYKQRRQELNELFNVSKFKWLKNVEALYQGHDKNEIFKLLDKVVDEGSEGVMINLGNYYYVNKRSKGLLKAKKFYDADLRIVGFESGTGKFKNTLGRINVEYKNSIVGVGSGLDDKTRNEIWSNQDEYLGKIVKVKYFEETSNSKDGKVSLRFPIFLEIRWDKDEPSYY